jgi:hypothetical protein
MKLHISIKFRAFGVTLGSFDQTYDLTAALSKFGFVAQAAATEASQIVLHNQGEETIYQGHGVLIELLAA